MDDFYPFCSILSILLLAFTPTISDKNMENMVAKWNGVVIAQSQKCVVVEGNYYFPKDSVKSEHLTSSDTTTVCGWKGTANYYNVVADGKTNKDAAWYYADPKPAADNIKGMVAFWKGVQVEKSGKAEL